MIFDSYMAKKRDEIKCGIIKCKTGRVKNLLKNHNYLLNDFDNKSQSLEYIYRKKL